MLTNHEIIIIDHWETVFRSLLERDRDSLRCILAGLMNAMAYKKPGFYDRIDEIVRILQQG